MFGGLVLIEGEWILQTSWVLNESVSSCVGWEVFGWGKEGWLYERYFQFLLRGSDRFIKGWKRGADVLSPGLSRRWKTFPRHLFILLTYKGNKKVKKYTGKRLRQRIANAKRLSEDQIIIRAIKQALYESSTIRPCRNILRIEDGLILPTTEKNHLETRNFIVFLVKKFQRLETFLLIINQPKTKNYC